MPYIKPNERFQYEDLVKVLGDLLAEQPNGVRDGHVNFVVSSMLQRVYDVKYSEINRAMGVLSCIQAEYYRRTAAPYEDTKIVENGDI